MTTEKDHLEKEIALCVRPVQLSFQIKRFFSLSNLNSSCINFNPIPSILSVVHSFF